MCLVGALVLLWRVYFSPRETTDFSGITGISGRLFSQCKWQSGRNFWGRQHSCFSIGSNAGTVIRLQSDAPPTRRSYGDRDLGLKSHPKDHWVERGLKSANLTPLSLYTPIFPLTYRKLFSSLCTTWTQCLGWIERNLTCLQIFANRACQTRMLSLV